ncbi:MAG: polymerase subunit delta [Candidatus Saccharibacteria bacterium]|nr:polymerase subunit delta [Candidatus Saccharibacteria bacterium]
MSDLVVHPLTSAQLADLTAQPPHAVMLVGATGSGKTALAYRLAEEVLSLSEGGFDQYGYGKTLSPVDDKAIGIEAIRELEHFLSLKVPSQAANHRIVIIEAAHKLTTEAQNALLKTLEEPPTGTVLILTASNEQALLPTIRSRVQVVAIKRPDRQALNEYFGERGFKSADIKQAYGVSGGLPGLMHALLSDDEHPLRVATDKARTLLGQTSYERLLMVDELAKQKGLALDVLFILQQMAHVSLQTATDKAAAKWQAILTASYQASEELSTSAQPKLALTNLMLQF